MSAKRRKNNLSTKSAQSAPVSSGEYATVEKPPFSAWIDKVLTWGLGLLCLFISICFYTGTYDTAYVKITLLQLGGMALLALWISLLITQKRFPISKQNLPWTLPFLVYFGWNFIGYIFTPYPVEAFEEFFRYVLYFAIALLILDRFTQNSVRILTKCIVLAAWISCVYGLLQVVNIWVPGADIMPWRGFFGARVFSTHANPNFFADFIVFSFFIIFAEYMRSKQKRLLVLMGISLVDLFFSESKGAWLGFAASAAFAVGVFTNCSAKIKPYIRQLNIAAILVVLAIAVLAGVYASKRFQSVSFRSYTWASTFDMVQASPVMGTGLGSFKTIYPAYRRPQIFYIEKIHNNETQHAENEYLEQWAVAGTVGLAAFLYFIFFVLYTGWRGLKSKRGQLAADDWRTLGYMTAFFGICVHNFFDVSLHFVSTGLFFAVFAALVVRLNMNTSIAEVPLPVAAKKIWLWIVRVVLAIALCALAARLIYMFSQTALNVGTNGLGGWVLKTCAWFVFCGLTLLGAWIYFRTSLKAKWVRVPVVLIVSIWPLQFVGGFFLADHDYGLAAGFSEHRQWDGALEYYQKAIELNPFFTTLRQYRAYILRFTMDMERRYSPLKGDQKLHSDQQALNDYERVLRDMELVRRRSPNNALLHHAFGEFYYRYAVYYTELSLKETIASQRIDYEQKAIENMELAKKSFARSLLIDPVNEATYVYLTKIAMMERNPAAAQAWIDAYRRGPDGVTEPEFLETHKYSRILAQMEQQLRRPPYSEWWNRTD